MKRTKFVKWICLMLCVLLLVPYIPVSAETTDVNGDITTDDTTDDTTEDPTDPELPLIELDLQRYTTTQRTLTWKSDSRENVYKVMRANKKDGKYKEVAQLEGKKGLIEYVDKNLKLGATYYYRVDQVLDGEIINTSTISNAIIRLLPAEDVKVSLDGNNDAKLSWKKVQYASGYYISRSTKKDSGYKRIATVNRNTFQYTDKSTYSARVYYYKIRAYRSNNTAANGVLSQAATLTCRTKPLKPVVKAQYTTSKKVKLSWKEVTRADGYYIYRQNTKGDFVRIGTTSKAYFYDSNVKANRTYKYRVRSYYKTDGVTVRSDRSSTKTIYTSRIDPNKKMVALTFDDGPGPYTQEIVNCLKKNNARATFFVLGSRVNSYKSALKSAYNNGNEIANHSYDHPTLTRLSVSGMKSQVNRTDKLIEDVTGRKTALMRAPGGATNSTVRKNISKPFIYWSLDTRDWETRSKSATINSVMKNVRDGDIVLMHDIHYPTKEAALEIIPRLKKAGYQLVTVSEMAAAKGYNMKNGTTYYSFR